MREYEIGLFSIRLKNTKVGDIVDDQLVEAIRYFCGDVIALVPEMRKLVDIRATNTGVPIIATGAELATMKEQFGPEDEHVFKDDSSIIQQLRGALEFYACSSENIVEQTSDSSPFIKWSQGHGTLVEAIYNYGDKARAALENQ